MKLYPVLALCVVSVSLSGSLSAEKVASSACSAQVCEKDLDCKTLADFDQAIVANPAAAPCLLKAQVAKNPAQLESLTLRVVSTFAQKLPADKLGNSLQQVMQAAVQQLVIANPVSAAGTADERREAALSQDLKLAGAVNDLTHKAVDTLKAQLAAPTGAIGPDAADSSLVIDPQAFASLMKGSMQQIIRGSLAGLGERAAAIPPAYLPAVASLRQDPGSYGYSLVETPSGEIIPSAVAAPVEEPVKK